VNEILTVSTKIDFQKPAVAAMDGEKLHLQKKAVPVVV
jgi:hypothetical protein